MRTTATCPEVHPFTSARIIRALRALQIFPGWERLATYLVPVNSSGAFTVKNSTGRFAGDISSFIDRRLYLAGGYETEYIREFVAKIPPGRRGIALDIGANVGTHSLAFARHFKEVHAFEPNPLLWPAFERNMALNNVNNVHLHKVGLGAADAELPFYTIPKTNYGLGTVSKTEQYDLPLEEVGRVAIRNGDQYLARRGVKKVDAVKIDVQGYELQVLLGLRDGLAESAPFIWIELGADTKSACNTFEGVQELFPFPSNLFRFRRRTLSLRRSAKLERVANGTIVPADYVIAPVGAESACPPAQAS